VERLRGLAKGARLVEHLPIRGLARGAKAVRVGNDGDVMTTLASMYVLEEEM
jgi:hypothetical protein